MMFVEITSALKINNSEILNVYPFGSRVYNTHNDNSDYDFVIVGSEFITENHLAFGNYRNKSINAIIYKTTTFAQKLREHSVHALECFYLPDEQTLLKTVYFNLYLDMDLLKQRILQKANYDWNKSQKRFEAGKLLKAKKSLFHSLRVLDFGLQILEHGKIIDYTKPAKFWQEINTNNSTNWEIFEGLFGQQFDDMVSKLEET